MRGWQLIVGLLGVLVPKAAGLAGDFPPLLSKAAFRSSPADVRREADPRVTPPRASHSDPVIQSGYSVSTTRPMPCARQPQGSVARQSNRESCAPQPLPAANPAPIKQDICPCPTCRARRECVSMPQAVPQSQPAPQAFPQAAPGMFVAPQARGEVAGESRSLGIRGFAIHFPAFHLELPTIQLPSCFKIRREPEMRIAESYAPYAVGNPALYGQLTPGGVAQVAPQPQALPQAQPLQRVPVQSVARPQTQSVACPQAAASPARSCPPTCELETQQLQQAIQQKTQSIQELKHKLKQLSDLEKELQQLTNRHQELVRDIQGGICNSASSAPPVDAPAPSKGDEYYLPK